MRVALSPFWVSVKLGSIQPDPNFEGTPMTYDSIKRVAYLTVHETRVDSA